MAISRTQASVNNQHSGTTTVTRAFGSACTSGTLLVAAFTSESKQTQTVSDPTNGTWATDITTATSANGSGFARTVICSVQNTATTALTVTGTTGANDAGYLQIYELSGAATSSALDTTASVGGNSSVSNTNPSSVTMTCAANDFIVYAGCYYSGQLTVGFTDSGYTRDLPQTPIANLYHSVESIDDSGGAGSKTLNWNGAGVSETYLAFAAAAYKIAGAGGGGGNPVFQETVTFFN